MKRSSALMYGIFLVVLTTGVVAAAQEQQGAAAAETAAVVEQKIVADPVKNGMEQLLELLKNRKLITDEEATSIGRQPDAEKKQENMNDLLNLLQSKGIISLEEADSLANDPAVLMKKVPGPAGRNTATVPLILPMDDRRFIQVLKDKWIDVGKEIDAFYPTFNDSRDPEYIIRRMKELEVITDDEAYELTRQYRSKYLSGAVSATLEAKEKDYLERIGKTVSAEMDKGILATLRNEWPQRIKLSGDMRLRFEADNYDPNNGDFLRPDNTTQLMNSTTDRNRIALRARLNIDAKVAESVGAVIGLATGSANNPVSTNATMGDTLNKKTILLDRAYLKWSPSSSLTFLGGRFPNPWFYSDLVWDQDVNFDGVAVQYNPRLNSSWGLFFNAGAFPIQEVEFSSNDKWLFGGQGGFEYRVQDKLTARLGAAYYQYDNTVGVVNNPAQPGQTDWTAPQFQQKGNTLMDIDPSVLIKTAYASKYQELNITGTLDLAMWNPIHIILLGDYVKNLGFDKHAVDTNTGNDVQEETEGYQFGVSVGSVRVQKLWDWKALLNYKYLEADAVMDAFTDSDFHLGGTNAKGWIVGGDLGVAKNTWISARWLTANEISGPPLAIDVFQFNFNARF